MHAPLCVQLGCGSTSIGTSTTCRRSSPCCSPPLRHLPAKRPRLAVGAAAATAPATAAQAAAARGSGGRLVGTPAAAQLPPTEAAAAAAQQQQEEHRRPAAAAAAAAAAAPPPRLVLSGASSGASARQGPARPGKSGIEDAHVLAALSVCTSNGNGSGDVNGGNGSAGAAAGGGGGGVDAGLLSNGGGVALARLGPRAGLRVPLSPAAAYALGAGGGGGGFGGASFSSADDADALAGGSAPPHLLLAGVFDGHAGHHTARQAALHLPRLVHAALVREQTALLRRGVLGGGSRRRREQQEQQPQCLSGADAAADAAEAALALAFPAFDRWWADARCDPSLTRHGWDDSGATAVVALLAGDRLVVANAGDSVALLVRPSGGGGGGGGGGVSSSPVSSAFVTRLTVEHRADNEEEAARVVSAGGRILSHVGPGGSMRHAPSPSASDADEPAGGGSGSDGGSPGPGPAAPPRPRPRISGMSANTRYRSAAVTRALGDFAFKLPQPLLTPEPHVCSRRLERGDDLLLLASDGVTDVLSDEAAAEVALAAARRERRRLEAAIGARRADARLLLGQGASLSALPDAELRRAIRQAAARAAADAVVREAHARGSGDDATCVAVFLDWQREAVVRTEDDHVVLPSAAPRRR